MAFVGPPSRTLPDLKGQKRLEGLDIKEKSSKLRDASN